ncbi:MAG: 3-hydroxyacyl-ACP dehydratase FabZ [Acidobacteria bacterium]|nr:3-hydroxyacyl-ACP dehydratase FabZ [Acidobacteriota bacterium]
MSEGERTNGVEQIENILSILPHRYPFLLVDRVLEVEERRIKAIKNVTFNEPFFEGHFPGFPVMPGVLIVEAIAQAGGCLLLAGVEDRHNKLAFFAGIDHCRFRRPVVPGDQLVLEVEVLHLRRTFARLHGLASVDGQVVCETDLMSTIVDKE